MNSRRAGVYLVVVILVLLIPGCENPVSIQVQEDVARALGDAGLTILYGTVPIIPEETFIIAETPIIAEETVDVEFTIRNDGVKVLELTGDVPVAFSTTGTEFQLFSSQPATSVSPGESVRFTVRFAPTTLGRKVASVTIECNVPDLPSFVFLIEGSGSAPSATAVPTGLTVTQGTSTVDVDLTWSPVSDATEYYIYRDTVDVAPETSSATSLIAAWTDEDVEPGQLYYYWVRAVAPEPKGLSDYSVSETGYCKLGTVSMTSATDGTSNAHITIQWATATGASTYEFYRSASATPPGALETATSAGITGTSHNDAAPPSVVYYYWARARAASSDSVGDWSPASVNGYREMPPPTITATGPGDNCFYLGWDAVQNAPEYRITVYADPAGTTKITSFLLSVNPLSVSAAVTSKWVYTDVPLASGVYNWYATMETRSYYPDDHWSEETAPYPVQAEGGS